MTPTEPLRAPFEAWRSAVAFWSSVALAPTRVAQAQARLTLRLWQAAGPWSVVRPVAATPTPAMLAARPDAVPHGSLGEASATAIAAATAESVTAAPTAELAEALPDEVVVPPGVAMTPIEALSEPAVLVTPDLAHRAVEHLTEAADASGAPSRARKPRKG